MPSRNRAREAKKAASGVNDTAQAEAKGKGKAKGNSKAKSGGKAKGNSKAKSGGNGRGKGNTKSGSKKKRRTPKPSIDPSDVQDADVRFIQPYEATKLYLCPGCGRDIPVGQGHLVAVPPDSPDLRRHWHRGCWNNRRNRL